MKIFSMFKLEHPHHLCNCNGNQSQKNIPFNVEEWLTHIIQEKVELEEAAFVGAKHDLAAKAG